MPVLVKLPKPPTEFTLYLDESGKDGRSTHTIFAGYVAHNEQWTSFCYKWAEELRSPPATEFLHSAEVFRPRRPLWPRLKRSQRWDRLDRFASIVNHARIPGFAIRVENAAEKHLPPIPGCERDHVENWCFYTALRCVAEVYEKVKVDRATRIAVVCDKPSTPAAEQRRRALFETLTELPFTSRHTLFSRFQTLDFKCDKQWPPLQAADLLAWQVNRNTQTHSDPPSPERDRLVGAAVVRHTLTRDHADQFQRDIANRLAEKYEAWAREYLS